MEWRSHSWLRQESDSYLVAEHLVVQKQMIASATHQLSHSRFPYFPWNWSIRSGNSTYKP